MVDLAGTAKQLPAQKVAVIFQKSQIEVPEKLHVLVLHSQLLRRIPVDHLGEKRGDSKKMMVSSTDDAHVTFIVLQGRSMSPDG